MQIDAIAGGLNPLSKVHGEVWGTWIWFDVVQVRCGPLGVFIGLSWGLVRCKGPV